MKNNILRILALFIFALTLWGTSIATVRVQSTNPPAYIGDSSDSKPTGTVTRTGSTFKESDTGREYIYSGAAWFLQKAEFTSDPDTLNAPGNGTPVATAGFSKCILYYSVASINTSVTTALQVRADSTNWTSVDTDSVIVTTNGYKGFEYNGIASADSLRVKFISEAGGTAAVIIYNAKLSNEN